MLADLIADEGFVPAARVHLLLGESQVQMEVVQVGSATLGLQRLEQLESHGVDTFRERHVEVKLDIVIIDIILGRLFGILVERTSQFSMQTTAVI